jgi:hypothetical protein
VGQFWTPMVGQFSMPIDTIHKKKEKEARDCELSTVLEFEEWQKLNGTYIKHPYNYVVQIER